MPSHKHGGIEYSGKSNRPISLNSGSTFPYGYNITWNTGAAFVGDIHTRASGGSQPHNNMPPYEVVNVWKRTA